MTQALARRPAKLLASPRAKLQLAAACAVVLAVGALLAPSVSPGVVPATPEESAAPLLGEQVQVRETSLPFLGVQHVARQVRIHGVAIRPQESSPPTVSDAGRDENRVGPSGFGVYINGTDVLTHAAALQGRPMVDIATADGQRFAASVAAFDPPTGLALLRATAGGRLPAPLTSSVPEPGSLAVIVGGWDGSDIAVPVFVTAVEPARYEITGADRSTRPGMPLYTLDGELAAIASAEQGDAVPVRTTIDRLLERARTGEQIASFGMSFQNRTDVLARVFGDRGVVVTTVTGSSPAAAAGARPGDVLLAIGEREIDNASEAASVVGALPIGVATTLSVRRAGRITKMNARPATSFELDALTRLNESPSGPEARLLLSGATLLAAGIPPSASVLLFNGRAITSRAQTDRELRRVKTPVPVLLRYRSRQFFVVVEPVP